MNMPRKAGFTMVEMIAVLVLIGILAASAGTTMLGITGKAKQRAAMVGISNARAMLSLAYTKAYLTEGGSAFEVDEVLVAAGLADGDTVVFGDITVQFDKKTATEIEFSVTKYQNDMDGVDLGSPLPTWVMPDS